MRTIGHLFIFITACVFTVFAVPDTSSSFSSNSSKEFGIDDITKARIECVTQYKARQDQINEQITLQTFACVTLFNHSANTSNVKLLEQISFIRSNLTTLKDNISNCTGITDNLAFVQCIQLDNDMNVNLMKTALKRAQYIEDEISNELTTIKSNQKNCMESVIQAGTRNYTQAGVDYTNCINIILNPTILT